MSFTILFTLYKTRPPLTTFESFRWGDFWGVWNFLIQLSLILYLKMLYIVQTAAKIWYYPELH